jgi:WD40 repeat protein
MDEHQRFELHGVRFLVAQQKAKLARVEKEGADQVVRLWDAATGRQIGPAMMHEDRVEGAQLSRDESRILSSSVDGSMRLWDAATSRQIGPAIADHSVAS